MKTLTLLLSLFSATAFAGEPLFKAPFTWSKKGHVVIEATINDRWTLPMAVDTGAAYAVLPTKSIESLGFTPSEISSVRAMTATDTRTLQQVALKSISVMGHAVTNQNALLLDLDKLEVDGQPVGVLPFTYLNRFNVLFDFENMALAFYEKDADVSDFLGGDNFETVPFTTHFGFIKFELAINGEKMSAILDTGAGGLPLMNWRAANLLGYSKGDSDVQTGREVRGAGEAVLVTNQVKIDSFTIGKRAAANLEMDILDMPHFKQMIGDKPAVNVGLSRLGLTALFVDYQNQRLYVSFG